MSSAVFLVTLASLHPSNAGRPSQPSLGLYCPLIPVRPAGGVGPLCDRNSVLSPHPHLRLRKASTADGQSAHAKCQQAPGDGQCQVGVSGGVGGDSCSPKL